MGLILIKHSRHIARLCSQNWSGNSIVLCIAILSYSTISPSRDNWWWSWSHYLLFDFIFRPHCKARSTLWHFKRQDWHFDYHLPMQSYRCLWLSYPISRQKRLKKSPRLIYNYNHNEHRPAILIGACYFHLSLSPSTNLFGSLVVNLHAWHLSNWAWASCLSFPFELLFLYYSSGWHISVRVNLE